MHKDSHLFQSILGNIKFYLTDTYEYFMASYPQTPEEVAEYFIEATKDIMDELVKEYSGDNNE